MTHEKVKYLCNHCHREYIDKKRAEQHEVNCFYLPENQACVTCKHLMAIQEEHHHMAFSEDQCDVSTSIECDIELDKVENDIYSQITQTFQSHCGGWELRTVKGTHRFGKTWIEEG
jgi:hypothetical protein